MYRIGKEEIDAVAKVIEGKNLFRVNFTPAGDKVLTEVEAFEKEWADKIGSEYALCVSGGTGALIAALVGMEIGPGDEVIVPGYTFMATAMAVLAVGAIPVIAEIDDTLTISIKDLERMISKNTKAVIPVHILGFPCDMDAILSLARKYNLKVLEDACQADGGSYKGRRLGSLGDAGAFSFNYFKILSAGEGGAIVTNDRVIYERALVYHDGGAAFRPYAKELVVPVFTGAQYRVSEITGAVMRKQLNRLDGILEDLRRIKKQFVSELSGIPGVKFARSNDWEGDCGTKVAFSFSDEKTARIFAGSEGVNGLLPIDSEKHVYSNWEPILNKRGAHHPALNPYLMPQNQGLNMAYSKKMCPNTLDILSKTVLVSINPDWNEGEVEKQIEACRKAVSLMI